MVGTESFAEPAGLVKRFDGELRRIAATRDQVGDVKVDAKVLSFFGLTKEGAPFTVNLGVPPAVPSGAPDGTVVLAWSATEEGGWSWRKGERR